MIAMDVLRELQRLGAVYLDKHFVYARGKHGSGYICMDPMFTDPVLMQEVGNQLVAPFKDGSFDVIVAPATGGVALGAYTAVAYDHGGGFRPSTRVPFVWADKAADNDFVFERLGFAQQLSGKRVLIVEDLLTTGGSVLRVRKAAEECGAEIIGVSAVCNRGGVTDEMLGVPRLTSLATVDFDAFDPDSCPFCEDSVPIVVDAPLGHGAAYKAEHPDYSGGYAELLRA